MKASVLRGEGSSSSLESLAAAVAAAVESEAFDPPASRSISSRRALRLAVTRRALIFDALAVVAGVRTGAMLDYCPGLEPEAAASVAAAASEAFLARGFPGDDDDDDDTSSPAASIVIAAHLDGCCYLLNSRLLGRAPPVPPSSATKEAKSPAGAFSGTAPWPIVFRGEPLAPRWGKSETEGKQFAASLAPLAAAVKAAAVTAAAARKSKSVNSVSSAAAAAASVPSSSSSSVSPPVFVDLDKMPSLPTAPALNAFLLGYPVAYSVGDREEAALASRTLRSGGGGREGSPSTPAASTTLALVTLFARALPLSPSPSSSSTPPEQAKLCSFSVPLHLWEQAKPRRSEEDAEEEGVAREGSGGGSGSGDDFVSLWVESVRASAVGDKSSKKTSNAPLSCLFRGEGLKASVEFVDSGGVTM